jgi:PKD repeat protein
MITILSHTYNLGQLDGYYTFTFKAWGSDVKSVSFAATTAQMLLETDKDVYILGENVTITLENIGNETVSIGGYPAWGIYTYPEESLVYPSYYTFLAWSLEPGENDTFIWNQYNAFTNSPVYPGMYVVSDTQGWGLSAYFTILPGNLPPIADFIYSPTFPYVGQAVTFDASDSSDMDGTIVSYEWDFGDGLMGTDVVTIHTYESAGTFTVTLTVTDDLGATDTLQQEITVDPLPTLTITINKIKKGTTETILLELVDDDHDGFITQDINNRILSIIKRTHKTTTFDFPGTYSATKGALNVTLQSRNDFTITLS